MNVIKSNFLRYRVNSTENPILRFANLIENARPFATKAKNQLTNPITITAPRTLHILKLVTLLELKFSQPSLSKYFLLGIVPHNVALFLVTSLH
jgi:hypothetical protein